MPKKSTNPNLKPLIAQQEIYESYTIRDDNINWWCGGCGNYAIQNALKRALALENISRQEVMFCYDVGCSGNGSDKIEGYTIHGLHGRVLPLAAGHKIANHHMHVIAEAGDGATFSEGVAHVVHAIRNDYPILFLHHDNQNYALTTGQPSSLTPKGCKMNAAPEGLQVEPLNPLEVVLSLKPSFVARTCSADLDHMTETIRTALNHTGFAFVEILQACPTYNKFTTHEWFLEHVKPIESDFPDYDPSDIWQARKLVEIADPLYLGQIYLDKTRKNFLETVEHKDWKDPSLTETVKPVDVSNVLKTFQNN